MKTLRVTQLKPNPAGKDKTRSGASPTQLGAEWIDINNVGTLGVDFSGVGLYHVAYTGSGSEWALVTDFKGILPAGQTVRIHSGKRRELSVLRQEDIVGAHHHMFTGEDQYIWNNDRADTAGLWNSSLKIWIDTAGYDPYPPEGVILVRLGDKLVASTSAQSVLTGRRF